MTKIRIDREVFFSKISKLAKFIPKNTVLPAFDNFKITVSNGNMEIIAADPAIQCKMNCPVSKSEDFSICLPAKLLVGTIGLFSENEVILTVKSETKIELKSGKAKYNITMDCFANDFPVMPLGKPTSEITLNQFFLNASLVAAQKFTDDKNSNTNATGININEVDSKIVFTGLDGFMMCRVAIKPISINSWDSIILPSETAKKVVSLLDDKGEISIVHSGDKIRFFTSLESLDHFEVTGVASNHKFPNSESLFKEMPKDSYSINATELLNAAKRLKLFAPSEGKPMVQFKVEAENELTLFSQDINFGKDGCEGISFVGYAEKPLSKAFNIDNLIDVLSVVDTKNVNFFFEENVNRPSFMVPQTESEEENMYSFLLTSMFV